jgi:hypothetical protein
MDPNLGRYGFRIAMFLTLAAATLLLAVPRGTAEFYITIITLIIGLLFLATVGVLVRFLGR